MMRQYKGQPATLDHVIEMGVVNCHVTTVDFVLHVHSKMQRTLFDFCSSQTEESDRVSDAESSLSLVSSDQDPVGDTHTDTLLLKPPLNPLKSPLQHVSGHVARQGVVNQISPEHGASLMRQLRVLAARRGQ